MIKIPAPIVDLINGQPRKVHPYFADNPRGYARTTLTWRYAGLMSLLVHAYFLVLFYVINVPEMVIFNVFSLLIFCGEAGSAYAFQASADKILLFINALPEPVFKYFSRTLAFSSVFTAIYDSSITGNNDLVYRHLPETCSSILFLKSLVEPI